jgi:hypothetical protein
MASLRERLREIGSLIRKGFENQSSWAEHCQQMPGFQCIACPSCQRLLRVHEDRIGDIIRCDEDTVDGCSAQLLVTCEAYEKVTPEGGPARLRLRELKPHPRPAQRMKDAELGIQRRGGW